MTVTDAAATDTAAHALSPENFGPLGGVITTIWCPGCGTHAVEVTVYRRGKYGLSVFCSICLANYHHAVDHQAKVDALIRR